MASFYQAPTENYVSTTLNGAIDDDDTTITLNDASKLQSPGVVVIDREDGNGTATPNSREIIHYTGISSNDLTGCTRGEEGSTARSHSDGALVEAVFTVEMWNDTQDAVSTALAGNAAGTALIVSTATISTAFNVSGASIVGIDTTTDDPLTLRQLNITSTASIARGEFATLVATTIDATNIGGSMVSAATLSGGMLNYTSSSGAFTSHASGANAISFAAGKSHTRQLTANTTITFSNVVTGQTALVRLLQDGTGSRTVTWNPGTAGATILWGGGTAPTLTTTANKTDVFGFYISNASLYDGYIVEQNI